MAATESMDWDAIIRDPRFQRLQRRKLSFLGGLMAVSVVYYFLLPTGAAYFQDVFRVRLWGVINVGLVFALSEFVVAWLIALLYSRRASRDFDRMAPPKLLRSLVRGKVTHKAGRRMKSFHGAQMDDGAALLALTANNRVSGFRAGGDTARLQVADVHSVCRGHRDHDVRDLLGREAGQLGIGLLHRRRRLSGLQNGWAIAGDYLSAASFLGIAGLISLYGYDGFMYSVGFLAAYVTVLLLIAEPCRNIGKYTLPDILAFRNDPRLSRVLGASR